MAGCRVDVGGRIVVLARQAGGVDCAAALVVSLVRLAPCDGALVVDRAATRDGAAEIWLMGDGNFIRTGRGARPWVIATQERLPMARTE